MNERWISLCCKTNLLGNTCSPAMVLTYIFPQYRWDTMARATWICSEPLTSGPLCEINLVHKNTGSTQRHLLNLLLWFFSDEAVLMQLQFQRGKLPIQLAMQKQCTAVLLLSYSSNGHPQGFSYRLTDLATNSILLSMRKYPHQVAMQKRPNKITFDILLLI